MPVLRRWRQAEGSGFAVSVPSRWVDQVPAPAPSTGTIGLFSGDGHTLRVERVLLGLIPVDSLMAQVSFESRQLLPSYEPGDDESVVVLGAGPARIRPTVTTETDASESFEMLELFAEGLDHAMWYVRVAARSFDFDARLAERVLGSFRIDFLRNVT